jgi:glucose-6-phosphate 1-dehydrogenase
MNALQTSGPAAESSTASRPGDPCIMVIFGASGDLTRRLLMPALYNLQCDGLLPVQFAIAGMAMDELTSASFRERLSRDVRSFNTRPDFDQAAWDSLCARLYYMPGKFGDEAAFARLRELVAKLDEQYHAGEIGRAHV